jgi:hypothetical protein
MSAPVLLHGCQNCAFTRADKTRTETEKLKFEKRKVTGHTLQDEISNRAIQIKSVTQHSAQGMHY